MPPDTADLNETTVPAVGCDGLKLNCTVRGTGVVTTISIETAAVCAGLLESVAAAVTLNVPALE